MFIPVLGIFDSSSVSCYKYRRLWRNHRKLLKKRERERNRVKEGKKKKKIIRKTKNRFFFQRGLNRREERERERRNRFVYKLKKSQNILEGSERKRKRKRRAFSCYPAANKGNNDGGNGGAFIANGGVKRLRFRRPWNDLSWWQGPFFYLPLFEF